MPTINTVTTIHANRSYRVPQIPGSRKGEYDIQEVDTGTND